MLPHSHPEGMGCKKSRYGGLRGFKGKLAQERSCELQLLPEVHEGLVLQ